MAVIDRVSDLVMPLVSSLDLTLYDIEHAGPVLRISVDKPTDPNGVGGADLTRLTRMISSVLDEADPVPGSYTLEVTSPGLERKLRTPVHFTGAIGTQVKLKLEPHVDVRRVEGVLVAADADSVTIRDANGSDAVFLFDDITTARTVFEWGPAPKPGKGAKRGTGGANQKTKNKGKTSQSRSAERSAG